MPSSASTRINFYKKKVQMHAMQSGQLAQNPDAICLTLLQEVVQTFPSHGYAKELMQKLNQPEFSLLAVLDYYMASTHKTIFPAFTDLEACLVAYFYYFADHHQLWDREFKQRYPHLHRYILKPLLLIKENEKCAFIENVILALETDLFASSPAYQALNHMTDMPAKIRRPLVTKITSLMRKPSSCHRLLFKYEADDVFQKNPVALKLHLTEDQKKELTTLLWQRTTLEQEHVSALLLLTPHSNWYDLLRKILESVKDVAMLQPILRLFHENKQEVGTPDLLINHLLAALGGEESYPPALACNILCMNVQYIPQTRHLEILQTILSNLTDVIIQNHSSYVKNLYRLVTSTETFMALRAYILQNLNSSKPFVFYLIGKLSNYFDYDMALINLFRMRLRNLYCLPIELGGFVKLQMDVASRQGVIAEILRMYPLALMDHYNHDESVIQHLNTLCQTAEDFQLVIKALIPHLNHRSIVNTIEGLSVLSQLQGPPEIQEQISVHMAQCLEEWFDDPRLERSDKREILNVLGKYQYPIRYSDEIMEKIIALAMSEYHTLRASALSVLPRFYASSGMKKKIVQTILNCLYANDYQSTQINALQALSALPGLRLEMEVVEELLTSPLICFYYRYSTEYLPIIGRLKIRDVTPAFVQKLVDLLTTREYGAMIAIVINFTPPALKSYLVDLLIEELQHPPRFSITAQTLIQLTFTHDQAVKIFRVILNQTVVWLIRGYEESLLEQTLFHLDSGARAAAIAVLDGLTTDIKWQTLVSKLRYQFLDLPLEIQHVPMQPLPAEINDRIQAFSR